MRNPVKEKIIWNNLFSVTSFCVLKEKVKILPIVLWSTQFLPHSKIPNVALWTENSKITSVLALTTQFGLLTFINEMYFCGVWILTRLTDCELTYSLMSLFHLLGQKKGGWSRGSRGPTDYTYAPNFLKQWDLQER